MTDFTTTVTIGRPRAEVFDAVLNARGWWNTAIDGPTTSPGDEFGFEVRGLARTRIHVMATIPGERVEWLVIDNEFGFIEDQTEWIGNRIVFDIEPAGDRTALTFTQHGLTPEYECYEVCSNAWRFFVRDSLRDLAESGRGRPESADGVAAPAESARAAVDALQTRLGSVQQRPGPR